MRATNLSVRLAVRLGGPLPRQLADGTRAPPRAAGLAVPAFGACALRRTASCGISGRFQPLFRTQGQLAHAILALPPLSAGHIATPGGPLDLHASSTLPAFVLSQNQTLHKEIVVGAPPSRGEPGPVAAALAPPASGRWGPCGPVSLVCFGMSACPLAAPGPLRSGGRLGSVRADESMYRAMAFDCQRAKGNAPRSWRRSPGGLRRPRCCPRVEVRVA